MTLSSFELVAASANSPFPSNGFCQSRRVARHHLRRQLMQGAIDDVLFDRITERGSHVLSECILDMQNIKTESQITTGSAHS